MSESDPLVFVKHILESINLINEYTKDVTEDDFLKSSGLQDSVIRRLEIIGEATRNLPDDFKKKHPDVPWHKILGTRNVLIHEYFGVDPDLVWGIIQKHLPDLKDKLEKLI